MSRKFEISQQVEIYQLIDAGWCIDSYDHETNTVTYLSSDGKLNAIFENGCDYGVVWENK